jgi:hypothetical protein
MSGLGLDFSGCTGTYQEAVNLLYMNCVDKSGVLVDRYQRLYVKPLTKELEKVDPSTLMRPSAPIMPTQGGSGNETLPIDNSTMSVNSTVVDNSTSGTVGVNSTTVDVSANITVPVNDTALENSTAPALDNSTVPIDSGVPAIGTATVDCWDYYQSGSGYEFSVCDGFGAIVRPEKIGGERDQAFLAQPAATITVPVSGLW